MIRLLLSVGLVLAVTFTTTRAQSQPTGLPRYDTLILGERFTDLDRLWLQRAAQAHRTELQLAALAVDRASHIRVRQLAPRLLRDHEVELVQLQLMADERGVQLPDITDIQQETLDRLRALQGYLFDRAFVQQIINEHQDQYGLYRDISENPNLDIRVYGERRIPSIREHLQRVSEIHPYSVFARWTISDPK